MKASHLAAIIFSGLGIGGMSSAAIQSPGAVAGIHQPKAIAPKSSLMSEILMRHLMDDGGYPIQHHPVSWKRLNQRQIRRNRRRAHAAGSRAAFA